VGLRRNRTFVRLHSATKLISSTVTGRAITDRFTHLAPDFSLNFGNGDGWSYLSGGIGSAVWSVVPDGATPANADREHLETINYGGGARWFSKRHVAFSFDVRFYAISSGTPESSRGGGRRTTLLIIGGGVSGK